MRDDAVLRLRVLQGSADFEEADGSRCVSIIDCDWTKAPGRTRRPVTPCTAATTRRGAASPIPAIPEAHQKRALHGPAV